MDQLSPSLRLSRAGIRCKVIGELPADCMIVGRSMSANVRGDKPGADSKYIIYAAFFLAHGGNKYVLAKASSLFILW